MNKNLVFQKNPELGREATYLTVNSIQFQKKKKTIYFELTYIIYNQYNKYSIIIYFK